MENKKKELLILQLYLLVRNEFLNEYFVTLVKFCKTMIVKKLEIIIFIMTNTILFYLLIYLYL